MQFDQLAGAQIVSATSRAESQSHHWPSDQYLIGEERTERLHACSAIITELN